MKLSTTCLHLQPLHDALRAFAAAARSASADEVARAGCDIASLAARLATERPHLEEEIGELLADHEATTPWAPVEVMRPG